MAYSRKTTDILISDELSQVLKKIESGSEIARLLLRTRHPIETVNDDHVNYISVSQTDRTKISYLTPDRFDRVDGDFWGSTRRFISKPGAFVHKLFKGISQTEVEKFASMYKSVQTNVDFKFKVVSGDSILKYYLYENYTQQTSSLGASCMKHDNCSEFLYLYTDNPQIKLLVMEDRSSKVMGRALLWDLETKKIMDRIYTIHDEDFAFHFKKWADENGYMYKKEQRWNNTMFFESNGKVSMEKISFQLKSVSYSLYPYLDTFKFLDRKDGTFYNYIPKDKNVVTLTSPDGSSQDSDFLALDERTNLFHHFQDTTFLPERGIRVHIDSCQFSDIYGRWILQEDTKYDEELNDFIFADDKMNDQAIIEAYRKRRSTKKSNFRSQWSSLNIEEIISNSNDILDIIYPMTPTQD